MESKGAELKDRFFSEVLRLSSLKCSWKQSPSFLPVFQIMHSLARQRTRGSLTTLPLLSFHLLTFLITVLCIKSVEKDLSLSRKPPIDKNRSS